MSEFDPPKCKTCPYWDKQTDDDGTCRRNPPSLPPTSVHIFSDQHANGSHPWDGHWPGTGPDDWCGEHPKLRGYIDYLSINAEVEHGS